jgi:hypothetical protein
MKNKIQNINNTNIITMSSVYCYNCNVTLTLQNHSTLVDEKRMSKHCQKCYIKKYRTYSQCNQYTNNYDSDSFIANSDEDESLYDSEEKEDDKLSERLQYTIVQPGLKKQYLVTHNMKRNNKFYISSNNKYLMRYKMRNTIESEEKDDYSKSSSSDSEEKEDDSDDSEDTEDDTEDDSEDTEDDSEDTEDDTEDDSEDTEDDTEDDSEDTEDDTEDDSEEKENVFDNVKSNTNNSNFNLIIRLLCFIIYILYNMEKFNEYYNYVISDNSMII